MNLPKSQLSLKADLPVGFPNWFNYSLFMYLIFFFISLFIYLHFIYLILFLREDAGVFMSRIRPPYPKRVVKGD